jgi:hypothetical protein
VRKKVPGIVIEERRTRGEGKRGWEDAGMGRCVDGKMRGWEDGGMREKIATENKERNEHERLKTVRREALGEKG